jgi:hypothetical protein
LTGLKIPRNYRDGQHKPDRIQLLAQIRRAPMDDQLAVLLWLQTKYLK